MIQYDWPVSLSPGNEQSFRWGSDAAATEGTYNYAGVKSAGVDAMIKALLEAKDSESFVAAVRALDRLLLSGDYVVPLFHLPTQWLAYWNRLKRPADTPIYGYQIDTWWAGLVGWATAPAVAHAGWSRWACFALPTFRYAAFFTWPAMSTRRRSRSRVPASRSSGVSQSA